MMRPPKKRPVLRPSSAYTLVELLTVVAIVSVLFAILFPVLASAKAGAKVSRDRSDLHQLGIAGAIYHDGEGRWPLDTPSLVASGLVPTALVVSIRDPFVHGQANDLVGRFAGGVPGTRGESTTYRRTYLGPRDYALAYSDFQKQIEGQPKAGWLVDLVGLDATGPRPLLSQPETGFYLRLMLDGGVIRHPYRRVTISPGSETFLFAMLYADGDSQWLDSLYPH